MALYESVLVFRQDLTDTQVKERAKKFADIVAELKGKVIDTEFWGLKTLAYIVRKNKRAHFVMFKIELPGDQLTEYERRMRIDEDVIRFLDVRVEAHAKGQSIMMKKSEEVE